jgi:hypothetical protein
VLAGNTSIAEGQAVLSFKILRKLNRETETDSCVQTITLPSGNALPCAEMNSKYPLLYWFIPVQTAGVSDVISC